MTWILALAIALAGTIAAGLALYLLMLAVASLTWTYRAPAHGRGRSRIVVLVPAHDEEELVARCVRSLLDQSYPRDLYRIVVIADNCADATAAVAADAGAEVIVRWVLDAKGKGRALRWAMDRMLATNSALDAVVVVDADSVADPDLLAELVAMFEAGHEVVQAEYLVLAGDRSLRTRLGELAFLLFHRVRLSGRAALGMPANLVGNGMLFSRKTIIEHPWNAFTAVEDLEYTMDLREAGIRPAFARWARVRGPMANGYRSGAGQRVRWEGGRLHLAAKRVPRLIKTAALRRDPRLLDAAMDLAVPPLAALGLFVACGLAVAVIALGLGLASAWLAFSWLLALGALTGFVLIGLKAAGEPFASYLALLEVPRFLAWKLLAYTRILRGFDPQGWDRAHRLRLGESPASLEIAGVRIDPVDMDGALARIRQALDSPYLLQVTTVNLDFLVRAQSNHQLRQAFGRSGLNLPDGAPVVWFGRLLGTSVPERVAGADLVPRLASKAAELGARVFLLGGEEGAARDAAARLQRDNPSLQIAGWLEPPRASLEEMDHDGMIEEIRQSRADILLVALGHPKQDLWIDQNRERLPVRVAIGVGCVFDILAGRRRRAPSWMQHIGLEWLHRLLDEPGRLLGRYTADLSWMPLLTARVLYQRIQAGPARLP